MMRDQARIDSKGWVEVIPKKRHWWHRRQLGIARLHAEAKAANILPDLASNKGSGNELMTIDGIPKQVRRKV